MVVREDFAEAIALPWLDVIEVSGPDAVTFLQGQLTNDVRLLADGRTQLAAFNSPQGRVIALLRLRQAGDSIYLLLPTELVEPVTARLRKFVLRAKAQLTTMSGVAVGTSGGAGTGKPLAGPVFDYAPGRSVAVVPSANLPSRESNADAERDTWTAHDIQAGLPQIFAASSEAFIPQMLNLDLLDGISFTKGCYTGQEIVARTQHLGRIKRRTLRFRVEGERRIAPMGPLFRDGAKVAEVVLSAPVAGGFELLAVTSLEARDTPLQTEDGRDAQPISLPYAV